jgi:hypothetical protein
MSELLNLFSFQSNLLKELKQGGKKNFIISFHQFHSFSSSTTTATKRERQMNERVDFSK